MSWGTIFLPTRGRVTNQVTLSVLPDCVLNKIIIICHPGEQDELFKTWGNKVKTVYPVKGRNIGEVRQKCIEMSDSDYIVFVDDMLNFQTRAKPDYGSGTVFPLKGMITKHFKEETIVVLKYEMFDWMFKMLKTDEYGMVGISRRVNNNCVIDDVSYCNGRICSFWGINRKLYNSLLNNPKFSDMPLKEDFYITLHFLTNGIKTITNYFFAYERTGGANSKGGCSIYRNLKAHEESAYKLHKCFPAFVHIIKKGTKSWGGEFKRESIDVKVDWKKAYEYGKREKQFKNERFF